MRHTSTLTGSLFVRRLKSCCLATGVLLTGFCSAASGQVVISATDTVRATVDYSMQTVPTVYVTNQGSSTATFSWKMTGSAVTPGIEFIGICDVNGCYGFDGSLHSFTLGPGDASYVRLSIQVYAPPYLPGCAHVKLWSSAGDINFKLCLPTATALPQTAGKAAIRIYPDPVADELHLEMGGEANGGQIKITDFTGRNLMSAGVQGGGQSLRIADLPAGNYIVSIYDAQGLIVFRDRILKR